MLPFTKRPNRLDDSEVIDSAEIEVVRVAPSVPPASMKASSRYPAPPADRPRVFERNGGQEEEATTVMPSKRGSSFPPASSTAPRSSARPKPPSSRDDEERTVHRPNGPSSYPGRGPSSYPGGGPASSRPPSSRRPPASFVPPPPPSPQVYAENGLHISTPPTVLGSEEIPEDIRAQATASLGHVMAQPVFAQPYMGGPPSTPMPSAPDSRMDPPATVITTRTRVLIGRPTVSWAAALVAMGIFVGLVTAVVARGDADSLIDATASFVDPAHGPAKAAAATPAPPPMAITPSVRTPQAVPVAVNPPVPAPQAAGIPVTDIKDVPKATQNDDRKASVAAVPRWRPAPVARPAPKPQPKPEKVDKPDPPEPRNDAVAAAPPPKPEKPEKPAKASKRGAGASDDDSKAAADADRLAREQLEAVLK